MMLSVLKNYFTFLKLVHVETKEGRNLTFLGDWKTMKIEDLIANKDPLWRVGINMIC